MFPYVCTVPTYGKGCNLKTLYYFNLLTTGNFRLQRGRRTFLTTLYPNFEAWHRKMNVSVVHR
jgi:hypothetical protein